MTAQATELIFGRRESEWDELVTACLGFLVERARAGLTNYTDLNRELARRTALAPFDFSQAAGRAALGHLLGLVADRTFEENRLLISALVIYLHGDRPADGFFGLAADRGLISKTATALERETFWVKHVADVQERYAQGVTTP